MKKRLDKPKRVSNAKAMALPGYARTLASSAGRLVGLHKAVGNRVFCKLRHAGERNSTEIKPNQERQIKEAATGGYPLPTSVRAYFEPRFGAEFSEVRIHTDRAAAHAARAVNARAYAVGRDIVFGEKQYAPHTPQGQHLLAHELVHFLQQQRSAPQYMLQRDLPELQPTEYQQVGQGRIVTVTDVSRILELVTPLIHQLFSPYITEAGAQRGGMSEQGSYVQHSGSVRHQVCTSDEQWNEAVNEMLDDWIGAHQARWQELLERLETEQSARGYLRGSVIGDAAFYNPQRNKMVFHNLAPIDIVIHELLHAYSHNNFQIAVEDSVVESLTELLANEVGQQFRRHYGMPRPYRPSAYSLQEGMDYLRQHGRDPVLHAYFGGYFTEIVDQQNNVIDYVPRLPSGPRTRRQTPP